jgi:hypothetical protein
MSSKHSNFWKQKDDGRASDYSGRAQDYRGRAQGWSNWGEGWDSSQTWDNSWQSSYPWQGWPASQPSYQQHSSSQSHGEPPAATPQGRSRGRHERYPDDQVLRCTWPGPRNQTFPPKGDDMDFQWATEYASAVNLATWLIYFFNFFFIE